MIGYITNLAVMAFQPTAETTSFYPKHVCATYAGTVKLFKKMRSSGLTPEYPTHKVSLPNGVDYITVHDHVRAMRGQNFIGAGKLTFQPFELGMKIITKRRSGENRCVQDALVSLGYNVTPDMAGFTFRGVHYDTPVRLDLMTQLDVPIVLVN